MSALSTPLWPVSKKHGLPILVLALLLSALLSSDRALAARYVFFPIIFGSPDTRLAGGAMIMHLLEDSPQRGDQIRYLGFVTTKKQYALFITPDFYFGAEKQYRLKSDLKLLHFPSQYHGIGNDTKRDQFGKFTFDSKEGAVEAQWEIGSGLWIGAGVGAAQYRISDLDKKSKLPAGKRLIDRLSEDQKRYTQSKLRTLIRWDTRDIPAYPSTGGLVALIRDHRGDLSGPPVRFQIDTIDLRRYFSVTTNQVFALQVLGRQLNGKNYHLFSLPRLGGTQLLRGYGGSRFRERTLVVAQADYRIRFNPKWGMGLFSGAGKVSRSSKTLKNESFHYGSGVGGYYFIDPRSRTALRLDLARAEGKVSPYVHFDHSF